MNTQIIKNRKNDFRLAVSSIIVCVVLCMTGCQMSSSAKLRSPESIVEEISVVHASYGEEATDKINDLLNELSSVDPVAGTRWKTIMDLWTSPRLGQPLNYNVLPDGLPDTDELCIGEIIISKNVNGTLGTEKLLWLKEYLKFINLGIE